MHGKDINSFMCDFEKDSTVKVSVILPVYNGERYLRESIDSVVSQTYKNWELIIVDDCSCDATNKIATSYAECDERVCVVRNEINMKLPESLNIGFRRAKGKYYTWTSDDNIFLPNALRIMVDAIERSSDIPMVAAGMEYIDEEGRDLGRAIMYEEDYMYYNNYVGACFLYRSTVINCIGEYDPKMFYVEDYDYWFRILNYCGKIEYIDEILYKYRFHDKSLTSNYMMVLKQKQRFRQKYLDVILRHYAGRKDWLGKLYFEIKKSIDSDIAPIREMFLPYFPELNMEENIDFSKALIVYGAGHYGNKAYGALGDKIRFYADKDIKKIDSFLNNKKVISLKSMKEMYMSNEYQIVVAVSSENVYKMLETLQQLDINKCAVFGD